MRHRGTVCRVQPTATTAVNQVVVQPRPTGLSSHSLVVERFSPAADSAQNSPNPVMKNSSLIVKLEVASVKDSAITDTRRTSEEPRAGRCRQ